MVLHVKLVNVNACCVPLQIMRGKVLHLAKLDLVDLSASWVHVSRCLLARMCIGVVSACLGKACSILS